MREQRLLLGSEADRREQLGDARLALRAVAAAEHVARAAHDGAGADARVERGERVLEDVLHAPPHRAQLFARERGDGRGPEVDGAAGDRHQAQDGAGDGGLAGTGFPDQPERPAGRDVERDAVDRVHGLGGLERIAAPAAEMHMQIAHAEQGVAHGRRSGRCQQATR